MLLETNALLAPSAKLIVMFLRMMHFLLKSRKQVPRGSDQLSISLHQKANVSFDSSIS